jgi:nicotinamide mononucleotide adenylyltransferase
MTQTELRETAVSGNGRPRLAKPRFNPTRLFVEKDCLAWFWFGFAMLVLVGSAVDRYSLVQSFKTRERVVVIDPANTFYVSPLLKFQEAKDLHAQQSTLAAMALLERGPKGFDNEDLLKRLFLNQAFEKASAQRLVEEPEFKAKQLHQKAEINKIDILNTREDYVLTQVTGQLVRAGVFQDKAFAEAVPFKLSLKLQRNPNMIQNGRFPTAVRDFKYETTN